MRLNLTLQILLRKYVLPSPVDSVMHKDPEKKAFQSYDNARFPNDHESY